MSTSPDDLRDGELIVEVQQALAALEAAMENNDWEGVIELNQAAHQAIRQAAEDVVTPDAQQALRQLMEQCQVLYGELIQRGTQYRDSLAKEIQTTQRGVSAANAYLKNSLGRG